MTDVPWPGKAYRGDGVTVTFDGSRCLHATECLRGLPVVFDTQRRPWIDPAAAPADQVAEVVRRCPSGALHYVLDDGPAEAPPAPPVVTTGPGEPLWVRGPVTLPSPDGPVAEVRAALCRCGRTGNSPYCDASGDCTSWRRAH